MIRCFTAGPGQLRVVLSGLEPERRPVRVDADSRDHVAATGVEARAALAAADAAMRRLAVEAGSAGAAPPVDAAAVSAEG